MNHIKGRNGQRSTRLAVLTLIYMLIFLAAATAVYAEEEPWEPSDPAPVTDTRISGIMGDTTRSASSTIKDTIYVYPARGRSVSLQIYDGNTGKWKTRKTFHTGQKEKDKLTVIYPKDWKNANCSVWRLSMSEGSGAAAYTSPKITIFTRNRETLNLHGKSAIIMGAESGQIFYGKSMDKRRANASTTKMMTAILALENKKWDSKATLSRKAVTTPFTTLRYKTGDQVKMKHLLYAALVLSDNGSATALAEHTAGSVSAFAKKMNQKAKELGCENTHFVNPHGLDSKSHYSTAKDLALIGGYAMKNPHFRQIIKTKKYKFTSLKNKKSYTFCSTNKLLGQVSGIAGIKTGTTEHAGCCFVGAYKHKGKYYITVVLGAEKNEQRWEDTKTLIRYIKKYI